MVKSVSAKKSEKLSLAIRATNIIRTEKARAADKNIDKRLESCKNRREAKFEKGELIEASTIKTVLIENYGYKCMICGISDWLGNKLTLHLDHIDGFSNNNLPSNVRLLCPNCHSQTPTFGARNKGKGRTKLKQSLSPGGDTIDRVESICNTYCSTYTPERYT